MALAIIKKFSLDGFAEGWDAECHILYKAVSYGELKALQDLNVAEQDAVKATDMVVDFVKEHFVSGKGMVLDADGKPGLGEIAKNDIEELPIDLISELFQHMTGQATDPKGTTPTTK